MWVLCVFTGRILFVFRLFIVKMSMFNNHFGSEHDAVDDEQQNSQKNIFHLKFQFFSKCGYWLKSLLGIYNLSKKQAFLAATLLDFSP
jgi:hypothetical protein